MGAAFVLGVCHITTGSPDKGQDVKVRREKAADCWLKTCWAVADQQQSLPAVRKDGHRRHGPA